MLPRDAKGKSLHICPVHKKVMCLYGIFFMGWVHDRLPGDDAVGWEWVANECCVGFTHVCDDLVGLRVQRRGRRGWC